MNAVRWAHVTGGCSQKHDCHGGGTGDAGDRWHMCFRTELAAQKHGENRSHQGQERHEHQQRRRGEFLHGGCGRRMDDGWNRVRESYRQDAGSDVLAL